MQDHYLQILHLAAMNGEKSVRGALDKLLERGDIPDSEGVRELLGVRQSCVPDVHVIQPNLADYDQMIKTAGGIC